MTTLVPKFEQPLTNAINRGINYKLSDTISVMDFIPQGTNTATTDVSSYIQNAINSITSAGAIYLPSGTYKIGTTLTFPANIWFKFYGDGAERTTLLFTGTGNGITASSTVSNTIMVNFEGFLLQNNTGNTNATHGIFLQNGQYFSNITDVYVDGFNKTGLYTFTDGNTYYYSGIFAAYCWGTEWNNVELRHNGNGASIIQCQSTFIHIVAEENTQHGIYLQGCACSVIGGVFQGNSAIDYNNNSSTTMNAEITIIGGSVSLYGIFMEGEGTNPPYSIIVDGYNATNRSQSAKINGCNITRSSNTANTRGCIFVNYAEETIIEGNAITPTYVGSTAAAAIPHITINGNALNTRIGHNSYRGRDWQTGTLYSWLPPIINSTGLPAYNYPFSSSNGGIKTIQKRLRLEWLLPHSLLTASLGETYALVPGTLYTAYHSLTRLVWLTNIQAIVPQGLTGGQFTVNVYNRVNDVGTLILSASSTEAFVSGIQYQMLNQHPYITLLQPGDVLVTVSTNSSFAPTTNNEIYIEVEFEEFDNH
jgi:hypothetical protein